MQIQPVTNQPNFSGKIVFDRIFIPEQLSGEFYSKFDKKVQEAAKLISEKPYDIFVMKNEKNPVFYNIAANTTMENAKNVKEYTVKIHTDTILTSLVDAAKDAMEMYEKYIAKGIKG